MFGNLSQLSLLLEKNYSMVNEILYIFYLHDEKEETVITFD